MYVWYISKFKIWKSARGTTQTMCVPPSLLLYIGVKTVKVPFEYGYQAHNCAHPIFVHSRKLIIIIIVVQKGALGECGSAFGEAGAIQLTVVCVRNSGYVSASQRFSTAGGVSLSSDDRAARHGVYVATGPSPFPRPSQKQDAVSGDRGSSIVAAVVPPRFLKHDDVCLSLCA